MPPTDTAPRDFRNEATLAIHRNLGNPTGQAAHMVAQLDDDEALAIADAGQVKATARRTAGAPAAQRIKDVLTRAYDRRRTAAGEEARQRGERLRRSARVRGVLEDLLHVAPADSQRIVANMTRAEQELLAACDNAETAQACIEALEEARLKAAGDEIAAELAASPPPAVAEAATDAPSDAAEEEAAADAAAEPPKKRRKK